MDAVKEKYYPVGNYDDQYVRWTMLHQKWDQIVSKFTNTLHTVRTKMGIKYSEWHLVFKYRGALHRYIQTKMEFLDISSLGSSYRYAVKIEQKFRQQNKWEFGFANLKQKSMVKATLTHRKVNLKTTIPSHRKRREMGRQRRTMGSGITSTKSLGTTPMNVTQNSH
jgi:hypothetical protein